MDGSVRRRCARQDGIALAADVASRGQYRLTAEEFRRMQDAGMLLGDARVELIESVMVPVAPITLEHS